MTSVRVVVLVVAAAATLAAQQPQTAQQTPPVFRGGTTIVPLGVTVLDKNRKPVTDLAQEDFTVFENDVKQELRSFFPQPFTPKPVPPGGGATLIRGARSDRLVPQTRRTFLLVLGWDRIQYPARALDGALKFVREHLLPQDLVAVMGFNRATDFTTDHATIAGFLERYGREHERICRAIKEYRVFHPGSALSESIQADVDKLFDGVGRRSAGDMLLGMNRAQPLNEKPWNRLETFDDLERGASHANARLSEQIIVSPLLKYYAGIEYLRYLEGEKHLVFLGTVVGLRSVDADKKMGARANDAGVRMNFIHTTGIESGGGWAVSSMLNIAEFTGGYATGVNYADKALATVDQTSRFSYLLGYAPTNAATDGTFRQVKVKVNRPGVTVLFHHGYYAVGDLSPLDIKDLLVTSRLTSGGGRGEEAHDIGLDVTTAALPAFGGQAQIRVDVKIAMSRIGFVTSSSGRKATVDLQIFCGDAKEQLVGERRHRLDINADDEETYQRLLREGVPLSLRVPVTAPVAFVKVVAYDYASDLMGTFSLSLKK